MKYNLHKFMAIILMILGSIYLILGFVGFYIEWRITPFVVITLLTFSVAIGLVRYFYGLGVRE